MGAAAINPVDLAVANGGLVELGITAPRPQFGLGWDVAGTLDATGPGVDLLVGDAVIGLADVNARALKTHAEHVVLDASAVAPAPRGMDVVAASTFGLNGLTALQALDALDLPPGASVLVTGAAGGLGGYAVELAKHRALLVVATASDDDEKQVLATGADHFVPRSADLVTTVRELVPGGVDGVVDAAVLGIGALDAVRNGGGHAHVVGYDVPPPLRGITVHRIFIDANAAQLARLSQLVETGVLSTRVARTFPLAEAKAAYAAVAKGGLRGRVVLVP